MAQRNTRGFIDAIPVERPTETKRPPPRHPVDPRPWSLAVIRGALCRGGVHETSQTGKVEAVSERLRKRRRRLWTGSCQPFPCQGPAEDVNYWGEVPRRIP